MGGRGGEGWRNAAPPFPPGLASSDWAGDRWCFSRVSSCKRCLVPFVAVTLSVVASGEKTVRINSFFKKKTKKKQIWLPHLLKAERITSSVFQAFVSRRNTLTHLWALAHTRTHTSTPMRMDLYPDPAFGLLREHLEKPKQPPPQKKNRFQGRKGCVCQAVL